MNYKLSAVANIVVFAAILTLIVLSLTNQVFLAVVEGRSMEPLLQTGDIVIVHRVSVSDLKLNDIVVYEKNDGSLVIHRIICIRNSSNYVIIITKGDNNMFPDPPITANQVIGKVLGIDGVIIKIPVLGYLSLSIRSVLGSILNIPK
ncbi:MAG: signal peptidase I [Desulfurococcales archaeon]|nr:signal peptidase I [Desulfurococcales archaeon]